MTCGPSGIRNHLVRQEGNAILAASAASESPAAILIVQPQRTYLGSGLPYACAISCASDWLADSQRPAIAGVFRFAVRNSRKASNVVTVNFSPAGAVAAGLSASPLDGRGAAQAHQPPAVRQQPQPQPQQQQPAPFIHTELISPIDGECVEIDDIDGLISLYEKCKAMNDACYAVQLAIRQTFWSMSEGTAKTRRVRGLKRIAKVVQADDSWDQAALRETWQAYPELRDEFLRIESIGVKMREFKKLQSTTGDAELCEFRDKVICANRGPVGTATLTVEK